MRSFLFKRRRVKICDSFSDWSAASRGVPQGSVLDPYLFSIFVNDFPLCVTKTQINTYADENQLHFSHECPSTIEVTINDDRDLQDSRVWFPKHSLKRANPHEFQSFGLAPGRSSVDFKFKEADQELKQENFINYLELPLTTNLTFMNKLLAYATILVDKSVYLTDTNVLSLSMLS